MVKWLRIPVVVLLAALAVLAATAPQADAARVPRLKHVWVFVLENHSYNEIIGNPDVPYLNHLARRHGVATQYYAVAHPSLPNYLAMISGSTHSCTSNGCQGNYRGRRWPGSSHATGCGGAASSRGCRSPATPGATAATTPATTTRSSTSEASSRSRASGTGSSPSGVPAQPETAAGPELHRADR